MDLSSDTNTYFTYIVNGVESNDADYHVQLQSELPKNTEAKAGPSHIPRPVKYMKKEPTAEINRNMNRNILFINEDDGGSSNRTSKKSHYKKRLLPSLHKFQFYTNIDSEESSSNFLSFGPKSTAADKDSKIEPPYCYTKEDINSPQYAEKTTYCRPVLNLYNQAFIYKTMERNARLQHLAKRLVDAREKEKQKEAWNNYVNELRNKHKYAEVSHIPNYVQDENPDIIDYYNTKFSWQQSNPCHNLLNDFYDIPNETNINDYVQRPPTNIRPYIFENNSYCYPTSSQGRLLALNRERQNNRYRNRWEYPQLNRSFRDKAIIVDKEYERPQSSKQGYVRPPIIKQQLTVNKEVNTSDVSNLGVQTESVKISDNKVDDGEKNTLKETYELVSNNVMRLKQKIMNCKSSEKINTLNNIENKIDILIDSLNTFISEIKSKKRMAAEFRSRAVSCESFDSNKTSFQPKKDHAKFLKDEIFCGIIQEKPNSMAFHENTRDTFQDILFEEMNKSDQVKKDIEQILTKSDHSCSVHIEFDIPTKETSTEVTDSFTLSKTLYNPQVNFEMFAPKENRKMTIAVNTDPLGLLALIRVSAETLKRLLSFVPQIDYYSYLSRLQFTQARTISSFVCNICGAGFKKPSQLSNHIQKHYLDKSRDCCVCRHVLDLHRAGLFKCQHCGQRFTRAYCKELHEQDCARLLGRLNDRTPSLVLLS